MQRPSAIAHWPQYISPCILMATDPLHKKSHQLSHGRPWDSRESYDRNDHMQTGYVEAHVFRTASSNRRPAQHPMQYEDQNWYLQKGSRNDPDQGPTYFHHLRHKARSDRWADGISRYLAEIQSLESLRSRLSLEGRRANHRCPRSVSWPDCGHRPSQSLSVGLEDQSRGYRLDWSLYNAINKGPEVRKHPDHQMQSLWISLNLR